LIETPVNQNSIAFPCWYWKDSDLRICPDGLSQQRTTQRTM
jgi:hypothetical protein